ncbi:BON domain-containing protein [Schlegelella sp. S2-27]|uniref:BON domain-containing protein n=1 Tax=Caldimonas mangrovi TaxID=2944811 RepID=A0ABT0YPG7_9BURK|nr:BON domain-containing protein [Caldimonas mangrovi]MCM5680132.1 BON domain-containing protein [Caldimonas mangrovi]
MRDLFSTLAALAAGAAAMYYLDPQMGRRRRAVARDRLVSVSHDAGDFAQAKGRRAGDRLKGAWAQIAGSSAPSSDAQLRERIRSRLGRTISHPRAVQVDVVGGQVCLRGDLLAQELDDLLTTVSGMRGVRGIDNQLSAHASAQGISQLQGSGRAPRGSSARGAALPLVALAAPVAAVALLAAARRPGRPYDLP